MRSMLSGADDAYGGSDHYIHGTSPGDLAEELNRALALNGQAQQLLRQTFEVPEAFPGEDGRLMVEQGMMTSLWGAVTMATRAGAGVNRMPGWIETMGGFGSRLWVSCRWGGMEFGTGEIIDWSVFMDVVGSCLGPWDALLIEEYVG